jgi:outer membrane protein assembly factor BamB
MVYITSTSGVVALDASDGSQRWQVALTTSSTNPSSPALGTGLLFFGGGPAPPDVPASETACPCLYALRTSDGEVVWTHQTGDQVFETPTVVDGNVYASGASGLLALRASDGTLLWSRKDLYTSGSPAVVSGVVYVAAFNRRAYALSAGDGSQRWQTSDGVIGPSDGAANISSTTIGDGEVYVADTGVVALRASDGTVMWRRRDDSERQVFSTPLVVEGVVFATASCKNGFQFFGYCQDQLVALRGSDGALFWSKTLTDPGAPVLDQEQASSSG